MIDKNCYEHLIKATIDELDAKNDKKIINYLTKSLENGTTPFAIAEKLAFQYRQLPKCCWDLVCALFELEVQDGNDDAMNNLGALYYSGDGVKQDYKKAVFYYNLAAVYGNGYAQENLGYCYYYGRVGEVDYEKAFKYYSMGAFTGRPISLYKIGDMYQKGKYVNKNEIEAFRIYNYALSMVNEEFVDAIGPIYLRLGECYLKGLGTNVDPKLAATCYKNAVDFLEAMVNGGNEMYRKSLQSARDGLEQALLDN